MCSFFSFVGFVFGLWYEEIHFYVFPVLPGLFGRKRRYVNPNSPGLTFLHWLGRAPCGEAVLNNNTGTIQSPDYPDNYPEGQECQWTIHVAEDMVRNLDSKLIIE